MVSSATRSPCWRMPGTISATCLFNAVFLLLTVGAISWEAIQRLGNPEPVSGATVMVVAAIGIIVNGVTAWLFASGRKGDLNVRGAFLHMAADALVSAGVVVAGLVILVTGWLWLDPIVSLAINAVIVWGTWGLLRDSVGMSMAAVPPQIDPAAVRSLLERSPDVASLHDLHIWPMSTTEIALTCHLVMPQGHPGDAFIHGLAQERPRRRGLDRPLPDPPATAGRKDVARIGEANPGQRLQTRISLRSCGLRSIQCGIGVPSSLHRA
jgi:cobalt-zinc-cadmium efflux system protein